MREEDERGVAGGRGEACTGRLGCNTGNGGRGATSDERRGREQRATRRATAETGYMTATSAYDYDVRITCEPQGFIIRPLLSPSNKLRTPTRVSCLVSRSLSRGVDLCFCAAATQAELCNRVGDGTPRRKQTSEQCNHQIRQR